MVLAVVLGFALAGVGVWVLRLPAAEPDALAAVLDDPALEVTRTDDLVTLAPAAGESDTTVVFYPGASVPPEAYLATWAEVVRDDAVTVRIPRMPLRLAVLDRDAADGVRAAAVRDGEDTEHWWIGGHSLGGAMAAAHLADEAPDEPQGEWDGLVLWAAYPSGDALADRDDVAALSVSGTRDGLTTAEDVEASAANLPSGTDFVVLDGLTHAQFGAYGGQRGDGTATVDDDQARREIADATTTALDGG